MNEEPAFTPGEDPTLSLGGNPAFTPDVSPAPLPAAAPQKAPPLPLSERDRAALAPAALLALLFTLVFEFRRVLYTDWFPGLGAAVFFLAAFAAALRIGRGGFRRSWEGAVLSLSYLFLALGYITDSDPFLRFLNLGVTPLTGLLAIAALRLGPGGLTPGAACNALRRLIKNLFPRSVWPLKMLAGGEKGNRWAALLGLLAALPLAAVVLALLGSADKMFANLLDGIFREADWGLWLWRGIKWLILFSLGFSLLSALSRPPVPLAAPGPFPGLPPAFLSAILLVLDGIYAVFIAVQFRYFFGGAETAAIEGGYAQYARSGFFQLVAVALINLSVALPLAGAAKKSRTVAVLGSLLLLATGIITLSAEMRMTLYVKVYGLSLLRLVTYWGIAVIAVAALVALLRLWWDMRTALSLLTGLVFLSWGLLSLSQPDLLIARYNERAWRRGELETLDLDYLASLSPDTLPVLLQLREEEVPGARDAVIDLRMGMQNAGLNEESLSWWLWRSKSEEPPLVRLKILINSETPLSCVEINYGTEGKVWGTQGGTNADGSPLEKEDMIFDLTAQDLHGDTPPEALEISVFVTDMKGNRYPAGNTFRFLAKTGDTLHLSITGNAEDGFQHS